MQKSKFFLNFGMQNNTITIAAGATLDHGPLGNIDNLTAGAGA